MFASSLETVRGDAVRVPPDVAGVVSAGVVALVALVDMLMLVPSLDAAAPFAGCCVWPALVVLTALVVFVVPSLLAVGSRPGFEGVLSAVATPSVSTCTPQLPC